jgi:hypothetical protein
MKKQRLTTHEMANTAGISYNWRQTIWNRFFEKKKAWLSEVCSPTTETGKKENQHSYLNTVLDSLPIHHIQLHVYFCPSEAKKILQGSVIWKQRGKEAYFKGD